MRRNNKVIVVSAIAAIVIVGAIVFAYTSGQGITNRFFSKNMEQKENTQNNDKTGINVETTQQSTIVKEESTQKTSPDSGGDTVKEDKKTDDGKKSPKEVKVKGVYLTGSTAGNNQSLKNIIELVKTTEVNSVVLDVKDDFGKVNYPSEVPEVKQNGAFTKLYDVDYVIKTLHENNVHVIGRIVCFKDPLLATKRNDLAIKRPNGQIWRENGKVPWVSPYNEEAWKYNIDIAKEAIDKGFDEIQFDYVRFPTARKSDVAYGENIPSKADTITKFVELAQKELHDGKGVIFSADVFGIICESPADYEDIGQDLEKVGKNIDYLSPMVYPSHYANAKQNGQGQKINGVAFKAPDLDPYGVVYNSLVKAKDRIAKVPGYKAKMRPYLQDFTASWLAKGYYQAYGAEQVKQQIKAVYDAGYDEWILWDAANTYTEAALEKEK